MFLLLLDLNDGKTEMEIEEMLRISRATVSNIKKRSCKIAGGATDNELSKYYV